MYLLSVVIFLPFVASAILILARNANQRLLYWVALLFALVNLGLAIGILAGGSSKGYSWTDEFVWVKELGLSYQVAVDTISAWLIVLTAFLGLVAVFAGGGQKERPALFWASLLA